MIIFSISLQIVGDFFYHIPPQEKKIASAKARWVLIKILLLPKK